MRSALPAVFVAAIVAGVVHAEEWSQFRGPNGAGHAVGQQPLPAEIGPDKNVLWKVELPAGHGSPAIHGDRIYLTAARGKTLLTLALDRATGKTLWQAEAPVKTLEKIHATGGSYAQSSPATDGEHVVSFFGSSGLLCYDAAGKLLWHQAMGPFNNDFGAGSSPIIVGDRVILNQDHDSDSCLTAFDKKTGKILWKTDRAEFRRGYATPIVWDVDGRKQIVVPGTLRVVGYDLETGKEVWTVRGIARLVNTTPVVGPNGTLYLTAWTAGADAGDRIDLPPFEDLLAKQDANKDGALEEKETVGTVLKERFGQFDRDKDGRLTKPEYDGMRAIFATAANVVLAIKPGGKGDVTESHVLWNYNRTIPYVPSPLLHNDTLFLIKDGGILTCLDAKSGKELSQERVFGGGRYHSSPVVGDGKIYFANQEGLVNVIEAQARWRPLSRARFEEPIHATPAIANGRIYLRTNGHLYCFGLSSQ